MNQSTEIQALINNIPLEPMMLSDELAESLIPILEALNRRMDELEAKEQQTANLASCLANREIKGMIKES